MKKCILPSQCLLALLNDFWESGAQCFTVRAPIVNATILTVELGLPATVRPGVSPEGYREMLRPILAEYRHRELSWVRREFPPYQALAGALCMSGVLAVCPAWEQIVAKCREESESPFGGGQPWFVGFDTSALRLRAMSSLMAHEAETGLYNFAVAPMTREELSFEGKYGKDDLDYVLANDALGPDRRLLEELWNQYRLEDRLRRIGHLEITKMEATGRCAEVKASGSAKRGDDAIIEEYRKFARERKLLLLSADRGFVDRLSGQRGIAAVKLERPRPREVEADWLRVSDLLYVLSIVYGVVTVSSRDGRSCHVFGVWRGKEPEDWHAERVALCDPSTALRLFRMDMALALRST